MPVCPKLRSLIAWFSQHMQHWMMTPQSKSKIRLIASLCTQVYNNYFQQCSSSYVSSDRCSVIAAWSTSSLLSLCIVSYCRILTTPGRFSVILLPYGQDTLMGTDRSSPTAAAWIRIYRLLRCSYMPWACFTVPQKLQRVRCQTKCVLCLPCRSAFIGVYFRQPRSSNCTGRSLRSRFRSSGLLVSSPHFIVNSSSVVSFVYHDRFLFSI